MAGCDRGGRIVDPARDPQGAVAQFIELGGGDAATAISIAAVIYVLYLGSGRYYVEHLLFFVHYHSFFFLGGIAVVLLLVLVVPITLSGYATYNDWGDVLGGDWIEEVHEFFGEAMLFVVLAHLALIAGLSMLRRKNQALPMLTGRVEGPGPNLVQKNRTWLAAALLLAVLAFGAWEWQQSPNGLIASGTTSERSRHHDDD